jgi:glutathione S-transferase
VHVAHAHRYRGYRWADLPEAVDAMKKKVPQNMRECFRLIDEELLQGPWVLGDTLSVCDLYLFTIGRWLPGDEVDIKEFPRVADHAARLQQIPAVQRVLETQ